MDDRTPATPELDAVVAAARARDTGEFSVIATDATGTIVYWNERAESLYGWTEEEVVGQNILEVTPTRNSGDEAARIMEELQRGQTWMGDFIVQRRDGTPLMAHVINVPVGEPGAVIGVVGLSRVVRGGDNR